MRAAQRRQRRLAFHCPIHGDFYPMSPQSTRKYPRKCIDHMKSLSLRRIFKRHFKLLLSSCFQVIQLEYGAGCCGGWVWLRRVSHLVVLVQRSPPLLPALTRPALHHYPSWFPLTLLCKHSRYLIAKLMMSQVAG